MPAIKKEVTDLKRVFSEELTLNHGQQQSLHHEIKKRVESIIEDYQESGFTKQKMYSQIHKNLRRAFSAPKYIFVKRKDYQEALVWVKTWRPLL
ncbi:ORF6C domain-containing protein [Priestia megaterium]|uniref:ORF6C domain-containing protein n=1 Tax=Priestia megaterium TaxID=1404 RepID=UPI0031FC3FBA